jgi:hypothetical protein
LGTQDLVLLKSLKIVNCQVTDDRLRALGLLHGYEGILALLYSKLGELLGKLSCRLLRVGGSRLLGCRLLLNLAGFAVDEFYSVSVDDAVTLTLNFKVVGNQVYGTALDLRLVRAGGRVAESSAAARRVAASLAVWHTGIRLIAESLPLTTHVVAAVLLTTLSVGSWRLLHVAGVVALLALTTHVHGLLLLWLAHELVSALAAVRLVRWPLAIAIGLLLLVGILIVGVLHNV